MCSKVVGMVTRKQLVQITENAIDNMITPFKVTTSLLYTGNDVHTYMIP